MKKRKWKKILALCAINMDFLSSFITDEGFDMTAYTPFCNDNKNEKNEKDFSINR